MRDWVFQSFGVSVFRSLGSGYYIHTHSHTHTHTQVPLELGWTFSVHRSQGMSLDRVQMSLGSVFEFGQAVRCNTTHNNTTLKLLKNSQYFVFST